MMDVAPSILAKEISIRKNQRALGEYRRKRVFRRTAEPPGGADPTPPGDRYAMHKHAASHDHYDLRLEQDGVLRSWALPKGPSLARGEKRLAVEVEDHPIEYASFEGTIPKGEYVSGRVRFSDHVVGSGQEFFDQACAVGLEGSVAKRADGPYRSGRTTSWLKLKRSVTISCETLRLHTAFALCQ